MALGLRATERRPATLAFVTLLGAMAAHGLLETARDALFLSRLPAARLPLVYLAVALLSVSLTALPLRRALGSSRPSRLAPLFLLAGVVTWAFFGLVEAGTWSLYALYVWSATVATLVVARFWLVVSERFDVTQAKRVYAFIGAGSVLGAILGTAIAGALTLVLPARHLLLAAGALFALAAVGSVLLERSRGPAQPRAAVEPVRAELGARALGSPYVRRVALLVLLSTIAVTAVDYAFKSEVAEHVSREELGSFFARFYLLANFASLGAQLFLVRWVVRAASTTGALAVLPVLLAGGGVLMATLGGLGAALATKGLDASLRHSLHRTAIELLYVPMSVRIRHAAKVLADVLGHRGGQALASLGILGAVALGAGELFFGLAIVLTAGAWLVVAASLRGHYLELFRGTLRESAQQPRSEFPELDLSSLESVIATLNSANDAEVRAALRYLADEGRERLVPATILYHPSVDVVSDALEILAHSGRRDFAPIAERLLTHPSPELRAAALRAKTRIEPDPELLERFAVAECAAVRITALVGLRALGRADPGGQRELEELARTAKPEDKIMLANAIRFRPSPLVEHLLVELARDPSREVRQAVLAAMAAAPSPRFTPALVEMLTARQLRADARATLVKLGDAAFETLSAALVDVGTPISIRRHIPRTLMRFEPRKSAAVLLGQLVSETDGTVRYKLLRALGYLRAHQPRLALDPVVIERLVRTTVAETYQLIEWRVALERGRRVEPARDTPTGELLSRLLRDKEGHALERLFRLIGLWRGSEDVESLYRGLGSSRADVRASSRELLEHLLDPRLRQPVLGLVDDSPDAERLAQAGPFLSRALPDYEQVLFELSSAGHSLSSVALYHVGELGIGEPAPSPEGRESTRPTPLDHVTRRAFEQLAEAVSNPRAAP